NVRAIASSLIREVANAGLGKRDVLPFWFGEPDEVTPQFIRDAAAAALARGETFYTHNFGLPELRDALAAYVSRLHGAVAADEVLVTNSGMSALMLISQALVGRRYRVLAVTPPWPDISSAPRLMGAQNVRVPLEFRPAGDGHAQWLFDLERLLD